MPDEIKNNTGVLNGTIDKRVEISGQITNPLIVKKTIVEKDYNNLENKPSINGVTLVGNKTLEEIGGNIARVQRATTEEWGQRSGEISEENVLYVYTDFSTDENGNPQPSISIGDGKAYIGDLPKISGVSQAVIEHLNNKIIHVSKDDRTNWDDKVKCDIDGENLIFSI